MGNPFSPPVGSTLTRAWGGTASYRASGSFRLRLDRFRAQATSQVLHATHRSVLTKIDFICLPTFDD